MSIPRPEYPRPDLTRESFLNLNGKWEFEIEKGAAKRQDKFLKKGSLAGEITVPFAPESKLSGVEHLDFMKSVWYRRTFTLPEDWKSGKTILHFGAVDYMAEVWVNGQPAGTHRGGYTPFSFDITGLLREGENIITLNARDDTKNPLIPTGKQSTKRANYGCVYTRCTGIWQTVWLEQVPDLHIKKVKLTPDVDNSCLHIEADLSGYGGGEILRAAASLEGKEVAKTEIKITGDYARGVLPVKDAQLWSPSSPVLYDLTLTVGLDSVSSYFGMRKVELDGFAIKLNGKPLYQRLILDQQYYPDGIYTAPTDGDLKGDIELSLAAGFNGARMHMKIFEPRFLYWADRLGYLLWAEYPNWGLRDSDEAAMYAMLPEWVESMQRDYNHPSVVGWCPFNETPVNRLAHLFESVYEVTKAIDPTRPVIDTSGYTHSAKTDIYDVHDYEQDPKLFKERYDHLLDGTPNNEIYVNHPGHEQYDGKLSYFVSEFGGIHWNVDGGELGWGYGEAPKSLEEFYTRYEGLVKVLLENPKMSAFCYTQLTDVQQEKNGLYTFARKKKFDLERIRKANEQIAAIEK